MSVLESVERVVSGLPEGERCGWRAVLALSLAEALDSTPSASLARELRSLMHEIQLASAPAEEDDLDKIISLQAKRKSASEG